MSHEINVSEFSQFLLKAKKQTIIPSVKPQTQMQYVRSSQKVLRDLRVGGVKVIPVEEIQRRYVDEHEKFDVSLKQARAYILHFKACVSSFLADSSSFDKKESAAKTEKQPSNDEMKKCVPKKLVEQAGRLVKKDASINEKLEEAEAERYMLDGAYEAIMDLLDAKPDPSFEAELRSELDATTKARCKLQGKMNVYRRLLTK